MLVLWVAVANAAQDQPLALDQAQLAELDQRHTLWGRADDDAWGAKVIDAPPSVVWDRILDFGAYADVYPYVTGSTLDEVAGPVYVSSIALTTRGLTTRYTMRSERHDGWLGFEVAPRGRGPVRSASGWWRVEPWDANRSLVTYTLTVDWWVPEWVGGLAERRAIPLVLDALARRVDQAELTAAR